MVALVNFASQQRLVVRRVFYVAAGTAALVSMPEILSSLPEREQRNEAFHSAGQLLQVCSWSADSTTNSCNCEYGCALVTIQASDNISPSNQTTAFAKETAQPA